MKEFKNTNAADPYRNFSVYGSYSKWENNELIRICGSENEFSPFIRRVHQTFRAHVSSKAFPCIGAKAALNGNCYRFGFYEQMNSEKSTKGLAFDLWSFVQEQAHFETNFSTFIAVFEKPEIKDEIFWEEILWRQLENLNKLDKKHYKWDKSVSSNPEDPHFSFSFAENAFFIVGLNPVSSRFSRRFPWATLVFNPQNQFQRLRRENKFERMQQTIRARDLKLQGSLNPNLSDFGDKSDARQYSGRAVEKNWKCPFHNKI